MIILTGTMVNNFSILILGIALACTGEFKEAEQALSLIASEKYRAEDCFLRWLVRV